MLRIKLLQLAVLSCTCVLRCVSQSPGAPKHRSCPVTPSARHLCLGWPAKQPGACSLCAGAASVLPLTLNTRWQVPEGGRAPQLETGTGNPPPPGTWPHTNRLHGRLGERKPRRCAPPLISTGSWRCSGTNSQLLLQQLYRSMLVYIPITQTVFRLLKVALWRQCKANGMWN